VSILTSAYPRLLDVSLVLLRAAIGGILFIAGAGKAFGWFGGMGLETAIANFSHAGITPFWAMVSTYTEAFGGPLLLVGFLTRPVAVAVTINMLVAGIVAFPMGFQAFACFPFSLMITSLVILLAGPMDYSIDALLFRCGSTP
jgi:putative oxidoreductase